MPSSDERMPRLAHLNAAAAALHLAAGLTILVAHPVLEGPVRITAPGVDPRPFAVVDLAIAAAVVVLLSAVVRLAAIAPVVRGRYEGALALGRHGVRWLELSQSAGITIVLIGLLNGVSEAGAIVLLYAISAGAVLLLWLQDRVSTPGRRGLAPFSVGAAIGLVPWGVVALYQATRLVAGDPVPLTASASTIAILLLAALQWVNVWARHQGRGPWSIPITSERVFIGLSVAHSAALVLLVLLSV